MPEQSTIEAHSFDRYSHGFLLQLAMHIKKTHDRKKPGQVERYPRRFNEAKIPTPSNPNVRGSSYPHPQFCADRAGHYGDRAVILVRTT
jgi:hypothetical protein